MALKPIPYSNSRCDPHTRPISTHNPSAQRSPTEIERSQRAETATIEPATAEISSSESEPLHHFSALGRAATSGQNGPRIFRSLELGNTAKSIDLIDTVHPPA